jgi:hypothetical protein
VAAVTDLRIVRLKLEDAIIQDADGTGEKLRFGVSVADKLVLCRFPTYGKWDEYASDMSRLMILLSQTAGDIELNTDHYDTAEFSNYALILGYVLRVKACRELVEKIFLTHLRPVVQGLEIPPTPRVSWLKRLKIAIAQNADPFETQESITEAWHRAFTDHWLREHLDFSHLFAMFQSILHPEEWLKKKAQMELRAIPIFQPPTKQSSTPTSPASSDAQSPNSANIQPYSFVQ